MELFHHHSPSSPTIKKPKLLTHIPDCANTDIFYPIPWSNKTITMLLVGFVSELYPIRSKFAIASHKKKYKNLIYRPKHPGYAFTYTQTSSPPMQYSRRNTEIQVSVNQQEKYADLLRKSVICIFDSSIVRKSIRKFMESLMSGCVIASDLPFEMEEVFRDIIIPLQSNYTEGELMHVLMEAVKDPVELRRKAAMGIIMAKKYFTCRKKIDSILDIVDEYNKGFRGYKLSFGVRLGCHSYLYPFDKPNVWC